MKRFWYMLTGGRPMTRITYRFNDMLRNRPVYIYRDKFGRYWLAEGPWSWFRVSIDDPLRQEQE